MVCPDSHHGDLPGGTRGTRSKSVRLRVLDCHRLWSAFPGRSTDGRFSDFVAEQQLHVSRLTTPATQRLPAITRVGFDLFPFRSPLLRESFLFLGVLRCFSSPGALLAPYVFRCGSSGLILMGFPHSEISGSTFATNFPELFAGNRVLLRHQSPRHPPCALCSLTYKLFQHPARSSATSSDAPGPRDAELL